ncbi:hypothetical protein KORDIASMS9_03335 [Kordia sp. SMS9]|uniref:hypothetical protein n=1 Tax=Kordia sp. SMS9 TaxID=2282170 RepID=UPI000E0D9893|nr:hypothetical protein [Kordia sp. SMS9]AXG71080.1 hypothetical protein KORDIASMS9_03335 [Kordia sp. SMS9]
MKKSILNIKGVSVISKKDQKEINGGIFAEEKIDLTKCGCDCTGSVTGPSYCQIHFGCLQVYTCDDLY